MNRLGLLQFATARGVGEQTIKKALTYVQRCGVEWRTFVEDPVELKRFGLSDTKIQNVRSARSKAKALWDELCARNVCMLAETDEEYPQDLKIRLGKKCPSLLFAAGNVDLLNRSAVGFCGSRKASERGLAITRSCAEQLTAANITIVSGYAAGTDLTAHQSALEHDGSTIFVLPEGILRAAKKTAVRSLLTKDNHVFVSQFIPDSPWSVGNAMNRNSVIVGLSRAMILVESRLRGGTFAAGEEALRVGCPLFVVDFAKPEATAEANAYFIEHGGQRLRGIRGVPNVTRVKDAVSNSSQELDSCQTGQTTPSNVQLSFV